MTYVYAAGGGVVGLLLLSGFFAFWKYGRTERQQAATYDTLWVGRLRCTYTWAVRTPHAASCSRVLPRCTYTSRSSQLFAERVCRFSFVSSTSLICLQHSRIIQIQRKQKRFSVETEILQFNCSQFALRLRIAHACNGRFARRYICFALSSLIYLFFFQKRDRQICIQVRDFLHFCGTKK